MSHPTPPRAYQKWKDEANPVLEDMLNYALNYASDQFGQCLLIAEDVASGLMVKGGSAAMIEHRLMALWQPYIARSQQMALRMNQASYVMAKAIEVEALGRVLPMGARLQGTNKSIMHRIDSPHMLGGSIADRIELMFERQAAKIAGAVRMGKILKNSPKEVIDRVRRTYPEKKVIKKPRLALVKVKEADVPAPDESAIDVDFLDQDQWDTAIEYWKELNLDSNRFGPQYMGHYGIDRYAFELERDMTDDFVDKVRAGEIDAANDNGINDFVWTAVIDGKTCENCCQWRDTLLVSEIEAKLNSGYTDECQATAPPAHPHCRCRLLPISSEFAEQPDVSWQGVDDWLEAA